ncbi:hypothetical protein DFS34DRAFT_652819 [Phlyctochytrium arcticum]|nr:hypothetical protein DFS34DRAFT_652819 [Phlyctochytrium arcticum]
MVIHSIAAFAGRHPGEPASIAADFLSISKTQRILSQHQQFLRAIAAALIRKKTLGPLHLSEIAQTMTGTALAAATNMGPGRVNQGVAISHKDFLRSIITARAAGRTLSAAIPGNSNMSTTVYGTNELMKLMAGVDLLSDTVNSSASLSASGAKGRSTARATELWLTAKEALQSIVKAAKECLANPWVDIGLVLMVTLAALSWTYDRPLLRLLGRSDTTTRGNFLDTDASATNDIPPISGNPDFIDTSLHSAPLEKNLPPPSWQHERNDLLDRLNALTSENHERASLLQSLTTERNSLMLRAEQLANALERSIHDATELDERARSSEQAVVRLEEENRVLVSRMNALLEDALLSQETGLEDGWEDLGNI